MGIDLRRRKKGAETMQILELRPYNQNDTPKTGWDDEAINQAQAAGKHLYVDQFGDIWTDGKREYVGKIRKERIK